MSKRLVAILAGCALVLVVGVGHAAAQSDPPSWSQKIPCSLVECDRFVLLSNWSNAAVLDRGTGLVWQRAPSTLKTFQTLQAAICVANAIGGRYGWRLPTQVELMTLGDAINTSLEFHVKPGHPFLLNVNDGTQFWTADHSPTD